jgi:hypothetical protein
MPEQAATEQLKSIAQTSNLSRAELGHINVARG